MCPSQNPSIRYQPILATAGGIIFVSTASIFIRFAQAEASSIVIAAARLVIASLVLVTTTPLWVALLSPLVLKEPIRKSVLIGLLISITGGVIVGAGNACSVQSGAFVCESQSFSGEAMLGNFLALFGAWMAAGYMLMGRQLRKKLNTIPYTALVYGIAALILVTVVILRAEPVFSFSSETYVWLLALGIFPQLLGHSLFNWALKYVSAAYVSLTLLGEPIGTIILALIFLNESPTLLEGVGAGLILIGIMIGSLERLRRVSEA
jgi:drug/metabolite transporter (DMT)-like permease